MRDSDGLVAAESPKCGIFEGQRFVIMFGTQRGGVLQAHLDNEQTEQTEDCKIAFS